MTRTLNNQVTLSAIDNNKYIDVLKLNERIKIYV